MSKNSGVALYKNYKEWYMVFNKNRKYKPRKKKVNIPTSSYYINKEGRVVFIEEDN